MIPTSLRWDDFEVLDDKREYSEAFDVVVEHKYQESPESKVLTALFPARAWIAKKSGELIVEYCHVVAYNHIFRRFSYCKENMPVMYLREKLLHKVHIALGLGALVLWDKENDTIVKPSDGRPTQWFLLWKDEPWYTWDNETQSYSNLWTHGLTAADYENSFLPETIERYNKIMGFKNKK